MSGTDMSSNTIGLPYSCKRAAFIFNLLSRGGFTIQVIGGRCLVTKCSDSGLCNRNVLFNRAGTCSNRTDDGSVQHDGYSTAEDDDLSRIAFLNAESGFSDCARVARSEVVLSKILAVAALSMARSMLPMSAPSWRRKATK